MALSQTLSKIAAAKIQAKKKGKPGPGYPEHTVSMPGKKIPHAFAKGKKS